MIILIATVSAGVAYFVANTVFGGMTEQGVKVKTIDAITSTVEKPDTKIFNENAINPSVEVNINNTPAEPAAVTAPTMDETTTSDTSSSQQ